MSDPSPSSPEPLTASLARQAAEHLAAARALAQVLHQPGVRARYRAELGQAALRAEAALDALGADDGAAMTVALARRVLVAAQAARAEDACHGANQLAQSAQRAPTEEDCEDGWRRVGGIVAQAEESALAAERHAVELGAARTFSQAQAARRAADAARRLIEERNHAYTFHADPGFSFGEGWYLAAAGVLTGVAIQIEQDKPQSAQAERFLIDAGLASRLTAYRPRPRANKALPDVVARAFREAPEAAPARLRAAFLGGEAPGSAVREWTDQALAGAPQAPKVLLWVRYGAHHAGRNTEQAELEQLARRALARGVAPVLVGDALREGGVPAGAADLTLFWKQAPFQGLDMRRAQLQFFEHLKEAHGLLGQIGVTTAGMDGPALLGLPTMYLTAEPNDRLGRWVGAVPGYEEVIRRDGYLERIERTLERWQERGAPAPEATAGQEV